MVPVLQRYRDAFEKVLRYPVWTHESYSRLKAVALMGTTRVLESFGKDVPTGDVVKQLRWLFSLFQDSSVQDQDLAQRLNTLLCPACEYVAVALQTHASAQDVIVTEVTWRPVGWFCVGMFCCQAKGS